MNGMNAKKYEERIAVLESELLDANMAFAHHNCPGGSFMDGDVERPLIYDSGDADVGIEGGWHSDEKLEELHEALNDMLDMLDEGLLVRSIARDHEPGWPIEAMRFIMRLKKIIIVARPDLTKPHGQIHPDCPGPANREGHHQGDPDCICSELWRDFNQK